MPRDIRVYLLKAVCASQGVGDPVELSGNIYGATFQNDPNDPNDERSRATIYPFPDGPITISQGQTVQIQRAPFAVFNLASDLGPKYLKFGGDLNNGLGSSFVTIDDSTLELGFCLTDGTTEFDVAFSNGKITLGFGLCVQDAF